MDIDAPITIVPFEPARLPLVRRFSAAYWDRPRDEAYYDWRYVQSQELSRMFLAAQGDECPGMLFGLRKRYAVAGTPTSCLEVCDWHTLPGLKGSGVGIRLMRMMMRQPERLFSIGGTPDVHKTLPAMGWQRVGTATPYELRTSGDALAESIRNRTGLPAWLTAGALGLVARAWLHPRRRAQPAGGTVETAAEPDPAIRTLYEGPTGYGLVQIPDPRVLAWTAQRPTATGVFEFLHFRIGGRLRGWALTRTYEAGVGREGAILEVFAPQPDEALYTWMVSAAACRLQRSAPRLMRARASCPILQAALVANAFRAASIEVPIFTWPKGLTGAEPVHCTMNHSDEPLRPYRPSS
jgi:hypothetical protein